MSSNQLKRDLSNCFDRMAWHHDRMLLDDLVFRLEHYRSDSWELGEKCFAFFKIKELVDQYAHFWKMREGFAPENVFELGIWDGGSIAFWTEILHPGKHVAIDITERKDSLYFEQYKSSRSLDARIVTYWNTDQSNCGELERIIAKEFDRPLDLVIDDASHLYHLTKASFETLFPHLRMGGLYIIEDWAWGHWKGYESFGSQPTLTQLIFELIEATGSSKTFISNVSVYEGFAVIERGTQRLTADETFSLKDHIYRGPAGDVARGRSAPLDRIKNITQRLLKLRRGN